MSMTNKVVRFVLLSLVICLCVNVSNGFARHQSTGRFAIRKRPTTKIWFSPRRRKMTMYVPPSTPTTQTAPMVGQKILSSFQQSKGGTVKKEHVRTSSELSNSVLASCDTLPRFPTAHGLLSPETIQRLDEMIPLQKRSEAVALFLDTYHHHGPMSCLDFLADPNVLPHLTEAMRDIA